MPLENIPAPWFLIPYNSLKTCRMREHDMRKRHLRLYPNMTYGTRLRKMCKVRMLMFCEVQNNNIATVQKFSSYFGLKTNLIKHWN
jgi:hypothetical protein